MKLHSGEPWMPIQAYAHSLQGLSINLLVRDIEKALVFQQAVLCTRIVYRDVDFAVLQGYNAEWMLHADHAYDTHALKDVITGIGQRGAGIELRVHGCDPDAAEAAARRLGFRVLSGATNTAHGLREAYLIDADGYVWVPDVRPTHEAGD